jgi:CheY-like chemotaxis protein
MTAFISHSFENKLEFDNIVDALVQAAVPYWNPAEVKPGSSLRDQLRQAVERCSVCIFVATHRALASSWCGAELGAFWGAGKPVLVYLADSSLADEELPPIVQGDVWERRIARVAARAKELVTEADAMSGNASEGRPAHVGNMTVEQLEKLIVGAVSLAAAAGKTEGRAATPEEIGQAAKGTAGRVLEGMKATERVVDRSANGWRKQILWVDDRPDNNIYERRAFESMGIEFTLALSTREALDLLSKKRFAAIISDMGRKEGPREGDVLLDAVRASDQKTPFFIYAGSNASEHKREASAHGAQGTTNMAQELFDMVIQALPENAIA